MPTPSGGEPGAAPETIYRGRKTRWCASWAHAAAEVERMAGELPLFWGSGHPIRYPHVVASTLDAWSGEGMGYAVFRYPHGDGYMLPFEPTYVRIGTPPSPVAPAPPPAGEP